MLLCPQSADREGRAGDPDQEAPGTGLHMLLRAAGGRQRGGLQLPQVHHAAGAMLCKATPNYTCLWECAPLIMRSRSLP